MEIFGSPIHPWRCIVLHQMQPHVGAAAASNCLLTGQILFSLACVGSCELPNWINFPRETNACLE
jgi:hypothetical protein